MKLGDRAVYRDGRPFCDEVKEIIGLSGDVLERLLDRLELTRGGTRGWRGCGRRMRMGAVGF